VPPWINKFYILDLRPDNSFVKWCLDQGHTVFMISWANPTKEYANKRFDDYLLEGPIAALNIIEMITKQKKINALGFCIGGTLLGCTAAYLAAKKRNILNSLTFLTTLLDFSIPGDLGVFIDEKQLALLDEQFAKYGFLDGRNMRSIFNLLRANDLIWNYYVNNYLEGKSPLAFDLLYWNGDSTNLAANVHRFYLHQMYGKNLLKDPDGLSLDGMPINLHKIKIPSYFIATEQDHIAPWLGVYKGATLFGGKTRFVLGGSGHIAGIINPPSRSKYGYRTNTQLPRTAQEWLASCQQNEGSWWKDWQAWISAFMGEMIPKLDPEKGPIPPIEDAPGHYVKVQLDKE
jgi:polyhydroxyalkanoate synthase